MRSAKAALAISMTRPNIPYTFVSGIDGDTRDVQDLQCARSVMADYDVIPISDMLTATRMWQRTESKVYDRRPLRGAPVYFPNFAPGKSGHVAEATGNGEEVYTTPVYLREQDRYTNKRLTSISQLEQDCGNAYTGWGKDIAGQAIDFTSSAGEGGNPLPEDVRINQGGTMFIYRYTCNGIGSFILLMVNGIVSTISVPTPEAMRAIQYRINMLADGFGRTDPKQWGVNEQNERAYLVPTLPNETRDFTYLRSQAALLGVPTGYDIFKGPFIPDAYYVGGPGASTDLTPLMTLVAKTLDAIIAVDTQDDRYQEQTIAALTALKTDIAAIPAATVKAEGAALANG